MFTKGDSKAASAREEITAFLGKETVFEGKMTFQGVFRLDGKFDGEVFDSGTLIVGESAVVKGKLEVQSIIIYGLVDGEVKARVKTEIHPSGRLYGTLVTPVLSISEGGILDGLCRMEKERADENLSEAVSQRVGAMASN